MAQIIVSVQMVYEERVINRRNIHPLAAVGWEGMITSYCEMFKLAISFITLISYVRTIFSLS